MSLVESLAMAVLRRFPPETAHGLSLFALNAGLAPVPGLYTSARLKTDLAGLSLPNPVGLAAGYDKNAEAIGPLTRAGFGFVEAGAVTPRPQAGNPRPRLFRLREDAAIINRMSFNNDGIEVVAARLAGVREHPVPVGLNLGANKDSDDRPGDYVQVLATCGPLIDFATVNVSSPNTEKLRDLQGPAALDALLTRVLEARAALERPIPVFVKIAPDLGNDELAEIAAIALERGLDGIVATNTTLARENLKSANQREAGGLSGPPLFEKSTRVLARLASETGGALPLIGVGGIDSAETAYAKILAGASALQVYTGLVYHGLSLVREIAAGLDALLQRDGFTHISQAVGSKIGDWL